MIYVCISVGSYKGLDFDKRETLREGLRQRIESLGIRFVEYCWVWDEMDQCLLVTGKYDDISNASQWIATLESMGFEIILRSSLPGGETEVPSVSRPPRIRRGWTFDPSVQKKTS